MDRAERAAAVFGAFDGTVSIVGFIFALLLNGSSDKLIAIGAVGGAISAMVSMGFGEFECAVGTIKARVGAAVAMAAATLAGCLIPIWGFFVLPRTAALCVAGGGALAIAGMIGQAKHKGVQGHVEAFATLLVAIALSFGVIALLPSAG